MDDRRGRRARSRALLAGLATLMLLAASVPAAQHAGADAVGDAQRRLQQAQQALQQAQHQHDLTGGIINRLSGQLVTLGDREAQLRLVIQQLADQIAAQQRAVAAAQAQLDRIAADLAAAQRRLTDVRTRLRGDTATLSTQLADLYKQGTTSTINAIFSSEDFNALWEKLIAGHRVAAGEQALLDAVNAEQAEVARLIQQISEAQRRQADVLAQQRATEGALEASRQAQAVAEQQLEQVIAEDKRQLAENQQAFADITNEISADAGGVASARASLAAAQAAAARHGNGHFIWPEHAPITQGFGCTPYAFEPYNPDCPSLHWHTGLDLAGPWGAPIAAGDGGIAYTYVSSYGYGLHVIIIHGNGFATVYGHLNSFAVGDGQTVSQGQTIGYEGSTGNSTGPHLHFEVRLNNQPVNPLAYLP